jgi:hypothetical protein
MLSLDQRAKECSTLTGWLSVQYSLEADSTKPASLIILEFLNFYFYPEHLCQSQFLSNELYRQFIYVDVRHRSILLNNSSMKALRRLFSIQQQLRAAQTTTQYQGMASDTRQKWDITSRYEMNSGFKIPVLGYGVLCSLSWLLSSLGCFVWFQWTMPQS